VVVIAKLIGFDYLLVCVEIATRLERR